MPARISGDASAIDAAAAPSTHHRLPRGDRAPIRAVVIADSPSSAASTSAAVAGRRSGFGSRQRRITAASGVVGGRASNVRGKGPRASKEPVASSNITTPRE